MDYARRAAEQANATRAYEEALVQYQRALQALGTQPATERCELLISLGTAQTRTGDHQGARASFLDAARLAREAKLPQQMAQVALGYELVSWRGANVAAVAAALAKEALMMNSPLDSAQRVLLFAALSRALAFERLPAAVEMHDTAVAMARRVRDPHALYRRSGRSCRRIGRPSCCRSGLRLAARRRHSPAISGCRDRDTIFAWHIGSLMEAGEIDEARAAMTVSVDPSWKRYMPFVSGVLLVCRTMFALHSGRFAEAERLARGRCSTRRATTCSKASTPAACRCSRCAASKAGWLKSRLRSTYSGALSPKPALGCPATQCCAANSAVTTMRCAAFEQLARDDLPVSRMPRAGANPAYLVDVCSWLGDGRRAEPLYRLLEPIAGRNLMFGAMVV